MWSFTSLTFLGTQGFSEGILQNRPVGHAIRPSEIVLTARSFWSTL
jgi:hypothetical protein